MIKVRFFASLREALGVDQLDVSAETIASVSDLLSYLREQGAIWADALSASNLLVAVNQVHADIDAPVASGDEVAIFPPVTGG